jgi:hypothetical protein
MKEILYTDFEGLDDLLSEMLENNALLKKAMKRSNLYSFWKKIVGHPFDIKSKPYGMLGATTMIVACESAVVVQELTLRKSQILKKLTPYVKSLNINLKDIMFDVKRWISN